MAPENVSFLIYSWDLMFDWILLQVPILELLVHMHSKSGDQERVSALITLLQQPALNVHNPQSIRLAHVAALEQRFLQRLCGELLWCWCWRVLASLFAATAFWQQSDLHVAAHFQEFNIGDEGMSLCPSSKFSLWMWFPSYPACAKPFGDSS